ncbi:Outer membrane protein assembly factor BamB [uncultured archaeon]|nr:Outer membrane protein assembly factor BamB [uncultured archaeon]
MRKTIFAALVVVSFISCVSSQVLTQRWNYTLAGTLEENVEIKGFYVEDINADEKKEVVVITGGRAGDGYTSERNGVYAFDGGGNLLWRYPIDDVVKTSTLAEFDNDGKKQVIVTSGQTLNNIQRGTIYVINPDGRLRRSFYTTAIMESIAVDDLDGDKYYEIIGGSSLKLYVFQAFGETKWEYRMSHPTTAVYAIDVDNSPGKEVIAAADKIYYFDGKGNVIGTFPFDVDVPDILRGVTYLNSINRTGSAYSDIVALTNQNRIYVIDVKEAKAESSKKITQLTLDQAWKYDISGTIKSFLISDTNDDRRNEIFVGSTDKNVYVLDSGQAAVIWQYRANGEIQSIYAADVDNDNHDEYVVATDSGTIYVLDRLGRFQWRYDVGEPLSFAAAGDINGDNLKEFIVGTPTRHIYAFDLNASYTKKQRADDMLTRGQANFIAGNYTEAQILLVQAKNIYAELDDKTGLEKTSNLLSRINEFTTSEQRKQADLYYQRAAEYFINEDFKNSRSFAEQAKEIYGRFGDSENVLKCELLLLRIEAKLNPAVTPGINVTPIESNQTQTEEGGINFRPLLFALFILALVAGFILLVKRRQNEGGFGEAFQQKPVGGAPQVAAPGKPPLTGQPMPEAPKKPADDWGEIITEGEEMPPV